MDAEIVLKACRPTIILITTKVLETALAYDAQG